MVGSVGVTVIEMTTALVRSGERGAGTAGRVGCTVVVPTATPVATPLLPASFEIVAMVSSEEAQVA